MPAKKTHKQYVAQLKEVRPSIKALGIYINAGTPIEHKCRVCRHIWNPIPRNLLHSAGCPNCVRLKQQRIQTKSHADYVADVEVEHDNIRVVERYKTDRIKLKHLCRTCDTTCKATPNNILKGRGCPTCGAAKAGDKMRQSTAEYTNKINANFKGTVKLIGEFKGAKKQHQYNCTTCNNTWSTTGCRGCPACSYNTRETGGFERKEYKLGNRTVLVQGYRGSKGP